MSTYCVAACIRGSRTGKGNIRWVTPNSLGLWGWGGKGRAAGRTGAGICHDQRVTTQCVQVNVGIFT